MSAYDSRLELAPRDIVARAIQDQMLTHGSDHVLLDVSHKPRREVLAHFPNIAARCGEEGIDITKDPIPVAPAQHYTCGGVATGLRGEVIGVPGLFAAGEVAQSGIHGANRLASNSLLEGLVFADRAVGPSVAHAEYAARHCGRQLHYAAASADFTGPRAPLPLPAPAAEWAAARRAGLQALMWRAAGTVRASGALAGAAAEVAGLAAEVQSVAAGRGPSKDLVELKSLVAVAGLILGCALQRRESRGGHFCEDFPELDPAAGPSCMSLRGAPAAGMLAAPAAADARGCGAPAVGAPAAKGPGAGAAAGKKSPLKARAASPLPREVQREVSVCSTPQDEE
jgi:L-aspartate oxidase